MSCDAQDFVVVYRGTADTELDMLEALLRVEGLQPLRLGKASAALLGAGESALLQLIAVPRQYAAFASTLIADSQSTINACKSDLETQALQARPEDVPRIDVPAISAKTFVLLLISAVLLYLFSHGCGAAVSEHTASVHEHAASMSIRTGRAVAV